VSFDADGKAKMEPFLTGFLLDEKADPPMWGRPNDVMVMRDGSMLVSDDQNGIIYRVSLRQEVSFQSQGAAAMFAAALSFPPTCPAFAADDAPRKAEACLACHGSGGNSTDPVMPSLAGQPAQSISLQLFMFREGNRKDPQMTPMAANLSNAEMNELAAYFSKQKPAAPSHKTALRTPRPGATSPSSTTACSAMVPRSSACSTSRGSRASSSPTESSVCAASGPRREPISTET